MVLDDVNDSLQAIDNPISEGSGCRSLLRLERYQAYDKWWLWEASFFI